MSNNEIQFKEPCEEYNFKSRTILGEPQNPKLIQWTIKYSGGLIKTEKQAIWVILGFVAVAIIISLFLIFGSGTEISEKNIFNPETADPDINNFVR